MAVRRDPDAIQSANRRPDFEPKLTEIAIPCKANLTKNRLKLGMWVWMITIH